MDKQTFSFLKAILGNDGSLALRRAIAKDPRLESYLVPRALLGWALSKSQYEGSLPGVDNIYVQFSKTEKGYVGSLAKDSQPVTPFVSANEYHLVAELLTTMGYEGGAFEGTDRSLVNLGKSIDALLKARALTNVLVKGIDLPGTTAKPIDQGAPAAPTKPQSQTQGKTTKPKLPKLPVLKVERKEFSKACKTCDGVLFKNQKFIGCMCWRDLAKHATTTLYSDGAVVEFSKSADSAAVRTLYREFNDEA